MHVEFSYASNVPGLATATGGDLDVLRHARMLDGLGLDGVLVDTGQGIEANIEQARRLLQASAISNVVVALCVDDMEPLQAARQFARLSGAGDRVTVSLRASRVSGTSYAERIGQLDEYAMLLKRLWLSDRPFEHQGSHYSLSCSDCGAEASIRLRIGGRSGLVQNVAAQVSDMFELPVGDVADTAATIARVTSFAAERGRAARIGFALPIGLDDEGTLHGVHLSGEPLKDTLVLLDYFEAGVGEFVLHGADMAVAVFAREVMPLVRNSVSRRFDRASDAVAPEDWQRVIYRA